MGKLVSKESAKTPELMLHIHNDEIKKDKQNISIELGSDSHLKYILPEASFLNVPKRPESVSSWEFNKTASQTRFKHVNYIYMDSIANDADGFFQKASRELCSTIGLAVSLISFLTVDLIRMLTIKLIRPLLQVLRFLFHIFNSIIFDLIYLFSIGVKRSFQPLIDLCSQYSNQVIVPVTSSLVFVRHNYPEFKESREKYILHV